MIAFVVRLLQVQAVDASTYAAKAEQNRYVGRTLAAERGGITDRDGVALATSVDAYDITADPTMFTPRGQQGRGRPRTGRRAPRPDPRPGRDDRRQEAADAQNTRYVAPRAPPHPPGLEADQGPEEHARTKAETDQSTVNVLAGVLAVPASKRVYPNGDLAAGILGWVNAEGKGGGGVEQQLDKELTGKDGKIRYAQSGGRQVPTVGSTETPAVAGSDVELTIDRDIQWAAQNAITEQVKKSKADRGYVIVQDTRTGEVLAMANAPGFDPNDLTQADPAAWATRPSRTRTSPAPPPSSCRWPPSSRRTWRRPRTHVVVPNRLHRGDRLFQDDIDHPTWYLTLNGVLAKSSNIGTILATGQLGKTQKQANQVLYSYLRKFGIGSHTGLGFPGETAGILAAARQVVDLAAVHDPFRPGRVDQRACRRPPSTRRSPTAASASNRPWCAAPRGRTAASPPPPQPKKTRVVSEKTAKTLAQMLESVVDDKQGTGTKARIPGYRVAGKTGTANRVDPATGKYHGYTSSFAGFAPADKPRITVYCAIQNATKGSYYGGQICGPVFKQVMEFALKTLQVPPTGRPQPVPASSRRDRLRPQP